MDLEGEIQIWRWIVAVLLTANFALIGIVYRGVLKRLDEGEAFIKIFVQAVVTMSIALQPDKASIIMDHMKDVLKAR